MNYKKYPKYQFRPVLEERLWPAKTIEKAPIWCSVDLRDGNQALPVPMSVNKKLAMFNLLKKIGFKEIEVSFPSASQTDFDFVRKLIEENYVEDVVIQVLTQSRMHLIDRTFEAIKGAKNAIVHLYNSTSVQQRKVVFGKNKEEIRQIALEGVKRIKELTKKTDTEITLEYSPESFTGTEMDFALEICEAVIKEWGPTKENKIIINLPATVEMSMPNIYADQIEWFSRNVSCRENVILSVHTHNDRGTGVAASELALLAGADRIEGTLFGNGERTGNVDIITMAMNLCSNGVDPELEIGNINEIIDIYEETTNLRVYERHPYAGALVYTAFSGSHQDAISKGLKIYNEEKPKYWEVPYLPIDPSDIGREYEAIIRINSQSGKGGVAFILESEYNYKLPKTMHAEFGTVIKEKTDELGEELSPKQILQVFEETYLFTDGDIKLEKYKIESNGNVTVIANVINKGIKSTITGSGNGPISAFFDALKNIGIDKYTFEIYEEHALSSGSHAEAVAYIELKKDNKAFFGVGVDKNTTTASFKAILSAINRYNKKD
jgi:2-isopropylmalate synthase